MPLNPKLYELLRQRFGEVVIAAEGQTRTGHYIKNPITNRLRFKSSGSSEEYKVNCPFCNDTRKRLYIHYKYGVFDPDVRSSNWGLCYCFNEDCLSEAANVERLRELIFGHRN